MNNCEICNTITYTDKHHIISKTNGGNNSKANIANLCPTCHRLTHKGIYIIEGRFLTSDGYKLIYHLKDEQSITNSTPDCYKY